MALVPFHEPDSHSAQSSKDFISLRKQVPRAVRKAAISMFVAHHDSSAALDSDAVSRTLRLNIFDELGVMAADCRTPTASGELAVTFIINNQSG
jgi:hypothetical protein